MRLCTAAALLPSASAEVVRDGGVLIDGPRIAAAGVHAARGGYGSAMAGPARQGPA